MPIRLDGPSAPEGDEPGGAAATQAMLELVQGRTLRCGLDGERTHDRCVGVCYLDGADISEVMVHRGVARDCPVGPGSRILRPGTVIQYRNMLIMLASALVRSGVRSRS